MADSTSTSVSNSALPEYIQPYVSDLFARGQALTGSDAYQPYTGPRVAGQTGLQEQAGQSVAGLDAGNLFTQGVGAMQQGSQYTPGTGAFGLEAAQQYMNPYQQQVTDINKREATRDAGIASTGLDSKLATSGAFGGSRHGVMAAEADRNLQQRLGDIQSKGMNDSYQQAQAQYNADQTRQQQDRQYGSQAAIKGGDALIDAGGKAFGLQSTAGLLDQQTQQKQNDVGYQDFLAGQQHPYDQLTFMRNLVSGFPGSTTTQTSNYRPDDSGSNWLSNLAGGVTAGKGIWDAVSSWFAEGGEVPARGGEPVPQATQSGLGYGRVAQLYGSLK